MSCVHCLGKTSGNGRRKRAGEKFLIDSDMIESKQREEGERGERGERERERERRETRGSSLNEETSLDK